MKYAYFLPIALLATAARPAGPAPCEVHLQLSRAPQALAASGLCRSLLDQPARYHYQLLTERWGRSHSRSQQGGSFELAPRQEAQLAQAQVSVAPGDHYLLRLRVYDEAGYLVAQDSVRQD